MDPCNRSRPRRRPGQEGRAATELTLLLGMLGFGLLAMGGLQLDALGKSEQGVFRKRAVEIARDQLALLAQRPAEMLAPGAEFAPAAWLSFPGREPGTLPVLVDPARRLQQVYAVSWRARREPAATQAAAAPEGAAPEPPGLQLEVRVQWGGADGDPPHVYTASGRRSLPAPASASASASRPPAAPRHPDGAASRAGTRPSPAPPARSPR